MRETWIHRHDRGIHHSRSKSAPDEDYSWDFSLKPHNEGLPCSRTRMEAPKVVASKKDRLMSLENDVECLQSKLKGHRAARGILEQALARPSSVLIPPNCSYISQNTRNLIRDIAILELEVLHLEQHLLSLYRRAYEVKIKDESCVSKVLNKGEVLLRSQYGQPYLQESPLSTKKYTPQKKTSSPSSSSKSGSLVSRTLDKSIGNRSFNQPKLDRIQGVLNTADKPKSSFSYSQPIQVSTRMEAKDTVSPLTSELWHEMISAQTNTSSNIAEECLMEQSFENSNKLSEELVRCMAAIYCKLADPPIPNLGSSMMSPTSSSSSSSVSTFSSKEFSGDGWSPHWRTQSPFTPSPTNADHRRTVESSSPHSSMIAVHWINVDNDKLHYAEKMLQNFKYMIRELERVDPSSLKHEEKLAFWLNIYNALMMHAYLAYGIPRNHMKRVSLLQKASYKIGPYSINAHTIEQYLLGCKSHRPAQWIQSLLSPVSKIKGTYRQAYGLERPEPLVCFAICCGGRSDPAVRVYTSKNVHQELDAAKRDFLQANVVIRDSKILVPKLLESFGRESSMGTAGLIDWISHNVSELKGKDLKSLMARPKAYRCIEWVPYSLSFRYLFVKDLVRWFPTNPHPSSY